jgi:putative MFS transporter
MDSPFPPVSPLSPGAPADIAARLERLPVGGWHNRVRAIVGVAAFFDAFDALAIASVLPVLATLWKLSPAEIGLLISTGYVGQAIGSVAFGLLAQRVGRVPAAFATVLIFSVMSCACAAATGYGMLLAFRFIQGLGLGGEQPVAHTYMNEISRAKGRARFILLPSLGFSFGVAAAAIAGRWIIPDFGWRAMFLIGVVPAVLMLPLRMLLPESPRWLASKGRFEEADRILRRIEDQISRNGARPLPPPVVNPNVSAAPTARIADLFRPPYRRRTFVIWTIFFSAYFVGYGLTNWMPTLYRSVYHVSLQDALSFGAITTSASLIGSILVTFLIDRTGRRLWFGISLLAVTIPFIVLGVLDPRAPHLVLGLVSIAALLVNPVCIAIGFYAAENYPTELRATAAGIGSAWIRIAAIVAPMMIGLTLPVFGITAAFWTFALVAAIGGISTLLFAIETKGRTLEDLSPSLNALPTGARP